MCIFDLEFLSDSVSVLLSRCVCLLGLSLSRCQSGTLSHPVAAPGCSSSALFLVQPPFSELGTGRDVLQTFPVVPTPTPPLGPPAPASGVSERLGWGVGGSAGCSGHPAFPSPCCCGAASKFGGGGCWEWRERGKPLAALTPLRLAGSPTPYPSILGTERWNVQSAES